MLKKEGKQIDSPEEKIIPLQGVDWNLDSSRETNNFTILHDQYRWSHGVKTAIKVSLREIGWYEDPTTSIHSAIPQTIARSNFCEQRGVFLAMLVRATVMAWKEGRGTFITGTIVEKILSLVFYGAEIQVKKKKIKRKGKGKFAPSRKEATRNGVSRTSVSLSSCTTERWSIQELVGFDKRGGRGVRDI